MKTQRRGFTLIIALAIVAICLAVAIVVLDLATHNGQNVGAGYTKQQYFDVAEAGIDRGLSDIDSNLPTPGPGSQSAPPPNPPPTPSGDQTALPSVPGVIYHYSYWHNTVDAAESTPDPLYAQGLGAASTITVPPYGTLVWSYTKGTGRDVGVEVLASVFTSQHSSCAICAGGNISVGGSTKGTVPSECDYGGTTVKICTDPNPAPNSTPTAVPIVMGGTYSYSGNCSTPCAYGDGQVLPDKTYIQQNANTSGFLDPQSTIDEISNANMWYTLSKSDTNVTYTDCSAGCSAGNVSDTTAGQTQFLNGNLSLSKGTTTYAGLMIVNGCMTMSGSAQLYGGSIGETIVLGTDAQCGGDAFSTSGNPLWWQGTLYTANGSVSIAGTGKTKFEIFYGDIIAAGGVSLTGNGTMAFQVGVEDQQAFFGQYAIASFSQDDLAP